MPDIDSHTENESLEQIQTSPRFLPLLVHLDVVSKQPIVRVDFLNKEPGCLNHRKGGCLVLNSAHQGESGGLVGAGGVLAHSVGIVVSEHDKHSANYMK